MVSTENSSMCYFGSLEFTFKMLYAVLHAEKDADG